MMAEALKINEICGYEVNSGGNIRVLPISKERLKSYCAINVELKGLERRISELEADVYNVKSRRLSFAGVSSGNSGRRNDCDFTTALAKLIDLKYEYEKKWDELIDERAAIEKAIEPLPHMMRAIIRAKYIDGMTWAEVADEVGYSERQLMRIVGSWK